MVFGCGNGNGCGKNGATGAHQGEGEEKGGTMGTRLLVNDANGSS